MEFELAYIVVGFFLGMGIGWLVAKNRIGTELVEVKAHAAAREMAFEEKSELLATQMEAQMENVANRVSEQNSESFLKLATERLGKVQSEANANAEAKKKEVESLVDPIRLHLEKLEKATTEMEKSREGAYQGLKRVVDGLHKQTTDLRDTNVQLSTALRGSIKARGNWGQISLKNIAESAGMLEHCDFDVEKTLASGKGGSRVDMLVSISDSGYIPVDAKVPLASYWDALEIEDSDARNVKMIEHAKDLKKHIDDLHNRDYAGLIEGADFTVMFIPADPILSAAYEVDPSLQEYAFRKHILIATPVTLIGLLRTVGIHWQQKALAENAQQIQSDALELYSSVVNFSSHLAKVGRGLSSAVSGYNSALGTYEGTLLPSGKRMESLKVVDGLPKRLGKDQAKIERVEKSVRLLTKSVEEE